MYYSYKEQGTTREVVIVQPNYEPHYEKFDIPEPMQLERFLELTKGAVDENTDYVVFPETSFGYVETTQMDRYPTIQQLKEMMEPYPKLKIITGLNAYHDFRPDEPHGRGVRERKNREGQTIYYEIYNAAIQLNAEKRRNPTL